MKKLNKSARIKSAKAVAIASMIMVTAWIAQANFQLVRNHSESLPFSSVLIKKGKIPNKIDQIFVFKVKNNPHYPNQEKQFIKLVGGFAGDPITTSKTEFVANWSPFAIDETDQGFYSFFRKVSEVIPEGKLEAMGIKLVEKQRVYVKGKMIGVAKTESLKGLPIAMIESGNIPPHKFFAYTPHKDSLDSRYQDLGLVDEKDIIGTAIATF